MKITVDVEELERIVRAVVERVVDEVLGRAGTVSAPAGVVEAGGPTPAKGVLVHEGRLLSEDEVVRAFRNGVRLIELDSRVIVTPAARDRAADLGVRLQVVRR